ncbi:MAG: metallophosphatase family protein [Desulfurococcales archaeon]|nr:metallophosphatase family protein [Desulfurococcales archaeon]
MLVVSDIHGNIHALKAVLDHSRGWDDVIVLGDLVDYGPNPLEVIDLLRDLGARIVRGNHDHAVAFGVDCRCGEKTHWLSVWFRENITLELLGDKEKSLLAGLPLRVHLDASGVEVEAVHAAPSNPLYAYLYPWLRDDEVCMMIKKPFRLTSREKVDCPSGFYLVGHTHYQFYRVARGAVIVNPGSVGEPRDGDPRASYALLDVDRGSVEFFRVKYPVDNVIRDLEALGVPEPYFGALRYMFVIGEAPPRP